MKTAFFSLNIDFSGRSRKVSSVANGPVSTRDNRVLKGPFGRSLHSFARTAHSAHSIRSAPLRYVCFIHGLAHSLRSLPRGTVEIPESVFMLRSRSKETNAIVVVTRNTPSVHHDVRGYLSLCTFA